MQFYKKFISVYIVAGLTACGGSNNETANNETVATPVVPTPATTLPANIVGTISAVNNNDNTIVVNGYELSLSGAAIRYAQETISNNALQSGMVVNVSTESNQVKTVEINPSVAGTVTSITDETLTVAGIVLQYEPNTTARISQNDYVIASTTLQADG